MKFSRQLPIPTRRDAWVEVNLDAIEHNVRQAKAALPSGQKLLAVIKADAYGHGAVMVIPTMEGAGIDMVGVAAMDEAVQLRQAGLKTPILILGGSPDWALRTAIDHDLHLTVFAEHHLEALRAAHLDARQPFKVHVKVDTGMNRIGVHWQQAAAFIQRCRELPFIRLEGIFSHLACGESEAFTAIQAERWRSLLTEVQTPWPPYLHLANSAGTFTLPKDTPATMVRMGFTLFGYGPEVVMNQLSLRPAMGLRARISHLKEVPAGEGISYGLRYRTERDSRIATLPLGYADGIPRRLSNQISAVIRGSRVPQIGTITMDQMMLDVSEVPDVKIGDTITLLGLDGDERITLTDWAERLDTIEYELMCGLRVRLPRIYTRHNP
jgi:alanine racemase